MIIPINTNTDKLFRQLVELLSRFPPLNKLRPRELDVLAELIRYNYIHRKLEPEVRQVVIFSTKTRKEICTNINMNEDTLNNNLSILRRNNVLTKDNKLPEYLNIVPTNGLYKFSIVFKLDDNDI